MGASAKWKNLLSVASANGRGWLWNAVRTACWKTNRVPPRPANATSLVDRLHRVSCRSFFFGFSISSDCRIEYQILVIRPSFTEKKLGNDRRDIKRPASVFFFFLRAAYVVMVVGFNGPRPAPVMALAKDETHLKKEKRKRNKRRTPSRGRVVPPSRWKK